MPAWGHAEGGLRPAELAEVVRYVRSLGPAHRPDGRPRRWVKGDAALGERLFASSCAGCHGGRGEGGEGPALANPVLQRAATDTYLLETIRNGRRGTPMVGFGRPTPVRRGLEQPELEAIVAFLRTWDLEKKP
jgi:mono/diheme cytochrome c family protein